MSKKLKHKPYIKEETNNRGKVKAKLCKLPEKFASAAEDTKKGREKESKRKKELVTG